MIPIGHVLRIFYIGLRYRLDTTLADLLARHWLRWLLPATYLPQPKKSSAVRLREALIRLGPIHVKFGQALSTRRDLLPLEFADELAKLQDRVPPFDTLVAIARIESELKSELSALFDTFDKNPIASASLAQVHGATLHDGSPVVVKVIRPDVEDSIVRDIRLLKGVSRFLERVSNIARRLHLVEVIEDYERTILGELDLKLEADNTQKLRMNFAGSPLLYVPRVYMEMTTRDVLVMERISGVPISAVDELRLRKTNLKLLARRGVETFFTQVFTHNFFHADMHPGNIFVDVSNPENPSYIAVDCAIIGKLTPEDQSFIARNIVAFFNRDFGEIARLHAESGWIPDAADTEAFEQVITKLCEPLFQKPLSEISFGQFLLNLFTTAREFHMEVQPQLVLLQKTLLNIEGLGRQLDPDLDLWATAKPFMEEWMKSKYGLLSTIEATLERAPDMLLELPLLPELLVTARRKLNRLDQAVRHHHKQLMVLEETEIRSKRRTIIRRLVGVVLCVGSGILLSSATQASLGIPLIATMAIVGIGGLILVLSR
ncbi:MAG: 2-polyprenylphenol 6-hydroxylase [Gammaproteobacteria bacterium]|nr:2-polyprenylphenol 6-hydroxylase [Gammaproteobacteria bacterium]